MSLYQQPLPDDDARQVGVKSNSSFNFTTSLPYRQVTQTKHQRSTTEDAESDSKSVQLPSLSTDESSRASSINNHEYCSEVDDSSRWLPHDDEHAPILKRSWSPVSMELSFHRTPMDLGTLQDRQTCDAQRMPDTSVVWPSTIDSERDASKKPQCQNSVASCESFSTSSANRESKAPVRQLTFVSELGDSGSESDEDSDDCDTDNDEWSGANDNIETALYEAVYPDIDLAAHMVSTMYPTLALNYRKKITRKVSSWQEKNIITYGTDSGSATTTKEAATQGTSSTGNGSSPKRDRQSSSHDDDIGDDEDDDTDEFGRKRPKKQSDSEPGIPKPRFACPFYKKDPVKYSAAESGRKACSGPGWTSISQLKEHLSRVHRPVQCGRCYHIFQFKTGDRSSAVAELEKHIQQDDRCPRRSASLKEGINDAEWSRLSEEKKINRKAKGKRKIAAPEQTQSPSEQWYEIWMVLFTSLPRPSTPWYPPLHSHGLPHNEHFLNVSKNVNEFKLPAIKEAIYSGSDEDVLTLLLECDQQKYSLYRSTFMAISDTTTDSFSNIEENDLHGSDDTGSWQKVAKDVGSSQQLSAQPATNLPLTTIDFTTQTDDSTPVRTSNSTEAMKDRREININGNPQTLTPTSAYVLENVQAPPKQLSSHTAITSIFQGAQSSAHNNHSPRARMGMDRNSENISQDAAYGGTSQSNYNYDASGYTSTSQVAYSNANNESMGSMWSPDIYDIQVPGDFDGNSFQPIPSLQNPQWVDQYPATLPHQFRRLS